MSKFFLTIIQDIIAPLFSMLAPELKSELTSFLQALYIKAKATTSPADDMVIKLIADILSIDLKG